MSDREVLVDGVSKLVDVLGEWMESVCEFPWDGSERFLPVMRRASLARQMDSLRVMIDLVASNHGYAAVPLLRPSCEELLWLRYFKIIDQADANDLIDCLISSGLLKDLRAQDGEVDKTVMKEMGLSQALRQLDAKEEESKDALRKVGERLDWPRRITKGGGVLSTWELAKKSGSESLYRFLYHATSRYVHFSPVELGRRGWGKNGKLHISASTYEPHWAIFALQWGARLFGFSIEAVLEPLTQEGLPEPPHDLLHPIFEQICEVPMIPLITADELKWESD